MCFFRFVLAALVWLGWWFQFPLQMGMRISFDPYPALLDDTIIETDVFLAVLKNARVKNTAHRSKVAIRVCSHFPI